jgi:hypothetical protein
MEADANAAIGAGVEDLRRHLKVKAVAKKKPWK